MKTIQKNYFLLCLVIVLCGQLNAQSNSRANDAEQPNIVWLVSEDNSVDYLKLYHEAGANMPNVESLAKKGLTFNHAFSNGPVCSVARSTLITSCYAPKIGVQYHRKIQKAPMPEGLEMFPYYLRQIGYYTTNNSKEDYNLFKSEEVWDESSNKASYKKRKKGQPFFHVQNFGTTHEGRLHFTEEEMEANATLTDPETMVPFPYHPNTKISKYTYAKYHDLHKKVDDQIGEFINQLEADGLMENTFIFYFGDHGGVLPRSKGYVYESGLHVPLVVYVPEKWKHLVPSEPGSRVDAFVSFIDFGPTVLNLAGAKIPKKIDGKPFLGRDVTQNMLAKKNTAFGYADRFDEKYDFVRSYRKGKYKYIRNYQPFNFDGLHNFYRYRMLLYQEWRTLYQNGQLNSIQSQFFQKRPAEQLFDLEKDPHEVNNLATDENYQEILSEMRKEQQNHIKSLPDLSFFPEPYFIEKGIQNPSNFGKKHKKLIAQLLVIADLQTIPFEQAKTKIQKALGAKNPWKRYWAWIVCSSFGNKASSFIDLAHKMAKEDPENLVRVRAAEFLGLCKVEETPIFLLESLKNARTPIEANLILNSIALLKEAYPFNLTKELFDPNWLKDDKLLFLRRLDYFKDK